MIHQKHKRFSKLKQHKKRIKASATEIAHKQAIKHETNDALKDDSPEAQEIQQAKAEAKEENKRSECHRNSSTATSNKTRNK